MNTLRTLLTSYEWFRGICEQRKHHWLAQRAEATDGKRSQPRKKRILTASRRVKRNNQTQLTSRMRQTSGALNQGNKNEQNRGCTHRETSSPCHGGLFQCSDNRKSEYCEIFCWSTFCIRLVDWLHSTFLTVSLR